MSDRPNVLVVVADDHRHDAIGALGDPGFRTPNLDRLAARGTACTHARIMGGFNGAVCVPTRAGLLTGCNPFRATERRHARHEGRESHLAADRATWPATLRAAGYRTHAIGKWHNDKASLSAGFEGGEALFLGGMDDQWHTPVRPFDPSGRFPADAIVHGDRHSSILFADAAIDLLRRHDGARPFACYLAFTAPHDPRTAPPDYHARNRPEDVVLPPNAWREHPFDIGDLDVRDERLAARPRDPGEVRRHVADYRAMVEHLDHELGRVLAALDERGLSDDTLVIYTADHGLAVGQHGLMGKQNVYEHSVRVPLIVAGPGVPRDRRVAAPVCALDLFPTLCGLCDVDVPGDLDGRDLFPLLRGAVDSVRAVACTVYRDYQAAACDGRWKLIRTYRSPADGRGSDRVQLFDLAADPWEIDDRAADPAARGELERLARALVDWQRAVGDPRAAIDPLAV